MKKTNDTDRSSAGSSNGRISEDDENSLHDDKPYRKKNDLKFRGDGYEPHLVDMIEKDLLDEGGSVSAVVPPLEDQDKTRNEG